MQNPQVLVKLFEKTHSDNAYNIFKSSDYEMIKQERSFRDLVIRGYAKSTRENHKESGEENGPVSNRGGALRNWSV